MRSRFRPPLRCELRNDALAVAERLARAADPSHRALARMIRQHNEDRAD